MQNYQRLARLVLPHWKRIAVAMVCMQVVAACTAAGAYLIKPVLDDIFVNKQAESLALLTFAVFIIFFAKSTCLSINAYLMSHISQQIVTGLRGDVYNHIQNLPLSNLDNNKTGNLMSRILNDVSIVHGAIFEATTGAIKESFTIVFLAVVIYLRNWELALIGTIIVPFAFVPLFKFGRVLRKTTTQAQSTTSDIYVVMHETIAGNRIVKAFGMEEHEKKRFQTENQRLMKYSIKALMARALNASIMEFLAGLGAVFVIYYGGTKVIQGLDTPGNFFSFLAALLMLYEPIKRLSNIYASTQTALAATARVDEIMTQPVEDVNEPMALSLPPIRNHIEFRTVCFAYAERPVLSDISFTIEAGQIVALVGMSGAGKTTLVNLIPRFYEPTGGTVLIDGIDIQKATISSLRRQIAIVTQQTILFNDSVRNNIGYGDFRKSDAEIIGAAKAANAYDFIMKMPNGFDTLIGEQGVRLSGGERQRICIARAILKDAPILVLDEATSSLDSDSELEVQKALENLMVGRTTLVIAHRLSTIQNADRIITLAGGRIVAQGRHSELMRLDSEYRRLYQLQFGQFSLEHRGIAFGHS
ncbi:MAG: ABC transporter ATP-binding protein [Syntrophobacteraceae bacterium]